jgi:formate hydrogenlyase subunit 3/multisubunit Na+/H+ antiporter MnhD subunit
MLGSIGLKIGTLPVSGVLPLSYTYTPTGAASALAGASAKVGALAMVRLLPAGVMPEAWSSVVMVLGIATAFVAAVLGTLTTTPRAVLGYSSASQMGLVLVAAGASLSDPAVGPLAFGAIVAFSLHHGLAKSALVIGDDVVSRLTGPARTGALVALALPALALVGAPLTSGFVAKYALKDAVHALGGPLSETVYALLPWTAVGTAALMLRFFTLTRARPHGTGAPTRVPTLLWGLLLGCTALVTWLWPAEWNTHAQESALSISAVWTATWPGLVALGGWLALRSAPAISRRLGGIVAPGDLLLGAASVARTVSATLTQLASAVRAPERMPDAAHASRVVKLLESRLVAWTTASAVFVLLLLVLVALATR